MTAKPLTCQQQNVLTFVSTFQQEHGYPPTLREIGEAIGLANINAVRGHLDALERKGYITRTPEKARSIQIIQSASRLSRVKRTLHRILRTDEGVLHRIAYGLGWATKGRAPLLVGPAADALRRALEREAAEHGWQIRQMRIEPDHVIVIVETWPNHSAQRTAHRLRTAGSAVRQHIPGHLSGKALWEKGYVVTTELELLEELVAELLHDGGRAE